MDPYLKRLVRSELDTSDHVWNRGFRYGVVLAHYMIDQEAKEECKDAADLHEALDDLVNELDLPLSDE